MNEYVNGDTAYQPPEPDEQIIDGKVVVMFTPLLNHVIICGNIYVLFNTFLRGKRAEPFSSRTALFLEEGIEEYLPDGMVVCDPEKVREYGVYGAPDLVVEVLSPRTAKYDRGRKKDVYEKHGVREYWLVEPVSRSIEQYVLENGRFVLRDVYTHYLPDDLDDMKPKERAEVVTEFHCTLFDDLTIRLEDVFRRVRSWP